MEIGEEVRKCSYCSSHAKNSCHSPRQLLLPYVLLLTGQQALTIYTYSRREAVSAPVLTCPAPYLMAALSGAVAVWWNLLQGRNEQMRMLLSQLVQYREERMSTLKPAVFLLYSQSLSNLWNSAKLKHAERILLLPCGLKTPFTYRFLTRKMLGTLQCSRAVFAKTV